jgi:hypothetical protein
MLYFYLAYRRGIVIFIAVQKAEDLESEYKIAHTTLRCYSLNLGYPLVIVDLSRNATLRRLCPQNVCGNFIIY